MARVKRGVTGNQKRKNLLNRVKGYQFGRSKKVRQATEALYHAQLHAFAHRKSKKRDFRRLWTVRINAALVPHEIRYSRFIKLLQDKHVKLDRKVLAKLAAERPEAFSRVVAHLR